MRKAAGSQSDLEKDAGDTRRQGRIGHNSRSVERRAVERVSARDLSEIIVGGMREAVTCMVRNLSAAGAMIEVARSDIPQRFVLVNHTRRQRALCAVVWQEGRRVGVRFLSPPRKMDHTC